MVARDEEVHGLSGLAWVESNNLQGSREGLQGTAG